MLQILLVKWFHEESSACPTALDCSRILTLCVLKAIFLLLCFIFRLLWSQRKGKGNSPEFLTLILLNMSKWVSNVAGPNGTHFHSFPTPTCASHNLVISVTKLLLSRCSSSPPLLSSFAGPFYFISQMHTKICLFPDVPPSLGHLHLWSKLLKWPGFLSSHSCSASVFHPVMIGIF